MGKDNMSGEEKALLDSSSGSYNSTEQTEVKIVHQDVKARPVPSLMKSLVGYILTFTAAICFGTGQIFAQMLGGYIPDFELNAWRYLAQLILIAPFNLARGCKVTKLNKRHIISLLISVVLHNLIILGVFTAAKDLAMGVLGGVGTTFFIIFTFVFTLIIDRKLKVLTSIAVVLCVVGAILVVQPPTIFGPDAVLNQTTYKPGCNSQMSNNNHDLLNATWDSNDTSSNSTNAALLNEYVHTPNPIEGLIWILVSAAASAAMAFLVNRKLYDVEAEVIAFWQALGGTVISVVLMGILETPVVPTTMHCILFLIGHGLGSSIGSIVYIASMQIVQPQTISIIMSIQIIYMFIAQYTFVAHIIPGHRNWIEILGACTVFLGNIVGPVLELLKDFLMNRSKRKDSMAKELSHEK